MPITYNDVHKDDTVENMTVSCANPSCNSQVVKDDSHRFGVGISHFSAEKGVSYMQVHQTAHSCSRVCAQRASHQRLDMYKGLEHGVMDASLNPVGDEYSDAHVESCINYTPNVRTAPLPTKCCVCGTDLTSDVYMPHVDDSSNGMCYQHILQVKDQQAGNTPKEMTAYEVGACSHEHAIQAAHEILDKVVMPNSR